MINDGQTQEREGHAVTMRFRPLCIDYHARAQDAIAAEREAIVHRARMLANPSPPKSRREFGSNRIGPERAEESSELDCPNKENRNGNICAAGDGACGETSNAIAVEGKVSGILDEMDNAAMQATRRDSLVVLLWPFYLSI